MKTQLLTVIICVSAVPIAFLFMRQRYKVSRVRAVARIDWIIGVLRLPGGNQYAVEYLDEIDMLVDKFDISPSEIDLDSWDELTTITCKAYRVHYLLTFQKHNHLKRQILSLARSPQESFAECLLSELVPLVSAYQHSSEYILEIRSAYRKLKDDLHIESSTFAHLDRSS